MPLSESILATLVTGTIGVCGIVASKFICLISFNGCCRCESCKFGFLDSSIVDDNTIEVKKISANNHDFIYVSKNHVQVDSDDESHHTTLPENFEARL